MIKSMDYKTTGSETSDHVGCFRFADCLILWSRWPQHSEICGVKKWRKYSKIIRIRVQLGFIRIVLTLSFICKL